MPESRSRSEYLAFFSDPPQVGTRQEAALRLAHDIRKFEIELYWKRASYFWTFIAAALAGYFALQSRTSGDLFQSSYIVSCLGFTFSLAWYFVNRGSKSWQRNWEAQVDVLEDEVTGPLYKSELNRYGNRFWDLGAGYHFSPSRINQLLGVFVMAVWLGLMARTLTTADWNQKPDCAIAIGMSTITLLACASFWLWGRSAEATRPLRVEHSLRSFAERPLE